MGNFAILLIKAIFTGLLTGIVIAIPMGPAGIESVRWTISKGFKQGILVAAGSLIADTIDVMLINFGLLELIQTNKRLEVFFWIISGVIILFIGYKAVKGNKNPFSEDDEGNSEKKKMKSNPLFTGFIINFSNPMTHSFWLTLSSTVLRVWRSMGKLIYFIFAVCMLCGMFTSLFGLNFLASKGKKLTPPKAAGKITGLLSYGILAIGVGFIIYGVYLGIKL